MDGFEFKCPVPPVQWQDETLGQFLMDEVDLEQMAIGNGQFGVVFKGHFKGETVVVKQMIEQDEEARKLFLKEARLLDSCRSEYVVNMRYVCYSPLAIMLDYECFSLKCFNFKYTDQIRDLHLLLQWLDANTQQMDKFQHMINSIALQIAKGVEFLHGKGK